MLNISTISTIILSILVIFLISGLILLISKRFVKCPKGKVLVIFGDFKRSDGVKVLNGGRAFVWPVIQDYSFLSLETIFQEVTVDYALSRDKSRVRMSCEISVSLDTDEKGIYLAANYLTDLSKKDIAGTIKNIAIGQIRKLIEQNSDETLKYKISYFLDLLSKLCEQELGKLGLRLISLNLKHIDIIATH
ncbi:SPFH domain-containing protein [Parvicella tangerina]|uniref:Band 7 domain-containing protein n=1 Tax=Parvicella tangerina TaxID=2829795 RepID=A0A916JLS3_9FLAO|nr:SPFH domain-containing protein [Parvicella tangerina]CAG5080693.1 hypothetical protein CRYO30217_01420 [Parvicella tangerina]